MTEDQIALVQRTWAQVEPIAPAAAGLFYDRLFAVAPQVRPLFAADLTEQRRKLMDMLGAVVAGLGALDELLPAVRELGRRHAGYGAAPAHYPIVGDCLLWTLAQGLDADFTPEVRDAWAAAYALLADVMIEAAGAAAA